MDPPALDLHHGQVFSSNVASSLGVPVCPTEAFGFQDFFLLVSFSRCKFRLTEEWVDSALSAVLGGNSSSFHPLSLDDRIFRFSVSCKKVGFLVLHLSSLSCVEFKLGFFLYNDSGFQSALDFSLSDSGPTYDWVEVGHKNAKHSYAQAVKNGSSLLSGANLVPLGNVNRSGAAFRSSAQQNSGQNRHSSPRKSVFHRISPTSPHQSGIADQGKNGASVFQRLSNSRQSVFERLNT